MRYRFRRTQRRNRYWAYRTEHFLPDEAKELTRLRRLDYHELPKMVRQRRALWQAFKEQADELGWSPTKQKRSWKSRVHSWYLSEGLVEKSFAWWRQFPTKNIWIWFDRVSSTLPKEQRYRMRGFRLDAEASANRQEKAKAAKGKNNKARLIARKMKAVVREPHRDIDLTIEARRLGFKGKSLLRAARQRGM